MFTTLEQRCERSVGCRLTRDARDAFFRGLPEAFQGPSQAGPGASEEAAREKSKILALFYSALKFLAGEVSSWAGQGVSGGASNFGGVGFRVFSRRRLSLYIV